jgi:hypothetical protein
MNHVDPGAAEPKLNRSISRKGAKHALSKVERDAKVTGRGPSSRADARDLRKISPFGRNDNKSCLVSLASWREKSCPWSSDERV